VAVVIRLAGCHYEKQSTICNWRFRRRAGSKYPSCKGRLALLAAFPSRVSIVGAGCCASGQPVRTSSGDPKPWMQQPRRRRLRQLGRCRCSYRWPWKSTAAAAVLEVVVRGGRVIRVPAGFDATTLAQVLAVPGGSHVEQRQDRCGAL
jgi:hypothetical protein